MSTTFIDLDGVLVDFVGEFLRRHKALGGQEVHESSVDRWAIHEVLGIHETTMWSRLEDEGFWASLELYPWSRELLFACQSLGGQVAILSSPGHCPSTASGKMRWAAKHLPGVPLILAHRKDLIAGPGRVLIDDSDDNCASWTRAGGRAVLFPQWWNAKRAVRAQGHHATLTSACKELT